MKKHANTLFITIQGCYVVRQGKCLVVRQDKKTLLSIPIHTLEGVVTFGRVGMSPFAMGLCSENGVSVSFMTVHGRLLARVSGSQRGNILLRRCQFQASENQERAADIARCIVIAKIANARTVLQRSIRDHPEINKEECVSKVILRLKMNLDSLWYDKVLSVDQVRGLEGDASRYYFSIFDMLILAQKEDFCFRGRNRRPPTDNINALLSFVYALLANDVQTACETTGLDPQMGFLHVDRTGRPSLALDIMEELRPYIADRLVLSLVNRRQVDREGFILRETGGVIMNDKTKKIVLRAYQERKSETLRHPFLNETITLGYLVHLQTRLLARFLRGDLDMYPAFLWK